MFEDIDRYRHEYKYIESNINLIGMESRLDSLMKKDRHVGDKGYYSIRSLYFDDYSDRFLYENIAGVDERTKWRIRIYDQNDGFISLERKIRKSDLIAKQSCAIDAAAFELIMAGTIGILPENPPLLNLFIREMNTVKDNKVLFFNTDIPLRTRASIQKSTA